MSEYICPICEKPLSGVGYCCGISYVAEPGYIKYDFDKLLFENYKNDYLLNKVLNNNGNLSYIYMPDGSVSLKDRDDVKCFAGYVADKIKKGNIIDIGCGPEEVPGYLERIRNDGNEFYGLDPLAMSFRWNKVIGCAEYIPFCDCYFDSAIFATSIDHVCSLHKSIKEVARILCSGGKAVVWHSFPCTKLKAYENKLMATITRKYNAFRYVHYPKENMVFYIPKGAIDQFHKEYISVKSLVSIFMENGLILESREDYNDISVFLSFLKK